MRLAPAACHGLDASSREVEVGTVQYRGQPFFYAVAGLPTLVDTGRTGAYLMRLGGLLPAARSSQVSAGEPAASSHPISGCSRNCAAGGTGRRAR